MKWYVVLLKLWFLNKFKFRCAENVKKTAASGNATLIWSCTVGKVTRKVAPTHSSLIVTNQSSACATCLAFRQWARRVWTLTEVTGMSRVRVLRMIHLREMRGDEKHSVQSVLLLRINFKLLCNKFFLRHSPPWMLLDNSAQWHFYGPAPS